MEMLGHTVSERIWIQGVLSSIGVSSKDPSIRYANIETPTGPVTGRIVPDVDADRFIGHSCNVGMRMISPHFRKSKFPRRWYVDAIESPNPIL